MSLQLINLSIGYNLPIAENLALTIQACEPLALLGPNGAGKTTLLRTILGLTPSLNGEIHWDQININTKTASQRAAFMGYVPQRAEHPADFSVHEFVLLGLLGQNTLFSAPSELQHACVNQVLAELGITRLQHCLYTRLSGGEQQLVLIARALARRPGCLILDEPTAHLDYGQQLRIMETITQLSDSGMVVLYSTHVPDHALKYSKQVLFANANEDWSVGETASTLDPASIRRLYSLGH